MIRTEIESANANVRDYSCTETLIYLVAISA